MCFQNQCFCLQRSSKSPIAKKISWFGFIKKLFAAKPKIKYGTEKSKGSPLSPQRIMKEAREEQRKQAVAVAVAMQAAAEAAVAAARAASQVVHLTALPPSLEENEKTTRNSAAVKIQTAYRAHLARKALKALKGLVRLQALVRGRIVRRQIFTNLSRLRRLPPIMMTQQLVPEIRALNIDNSCKDYIKKQLRCNSQKKWDQSLVSKEDTEALWLRKQEASLKRERMKKYSFSYRERRNDCDLETLEKKREMSNSISVATYGASQLKLKNTPKHDLLKELKFPFTLPRRSLCHSKKKSFVDESSLPNSPDFATYITATESVKAKIRSTRMGLFDYNSSHKARISTWSTFDDDFSITNGRRYVPEQISLSMNGCH